MLYSASAPRPLWDPSAIGSAIGRPLSRPISPANTGGSPQPPRSKPLTGLSRAIVVLLCLKPIKTSATEKRHRGLDSQPRPRPRLNSQLQGATKCVWSCVLLFDIWSVVLCVVQDEDRPLSKNISEAAETRQVARSAQIP